MSVRFLVPLSVALALAGQLSAQPATGVLPVGPKAHDFVYEQMERTQALSRDRYDYQLGPYHLDQLSLENTPLAKFGTVTGTQLAVFSSVGEAFTGAHAARPNAREAVRGGIALRPLNRLFVYGNFILDEARAKDPSYAGKKWRGLAGDVEQAFACWQTPRFDVMVGRFASFWGNQRSLVLGPNVALDGLAYSYRWGKLTLSYRLAKLDAPRHTSDSSTQFDNRYFAGHRLDLHLNDHLRLGVFETVIWGGVGRQIELYYLNPLIFFHGSQLNQGANDNTFVGFDLSIKPMSGYHLYGQLLIDDFQIEKKSPGDQEPNEIGFLAGAYVADLISGYDLKAEYSRVTNWTFNQNLERNRYQFENQLISAAQGNDYDQANVSLIRWFGPQIATSVRASFGRQGEGRVDAAWTAPWMQSAGPYHESFLTGIVQSTATVSLGCKGYLGKVVEFDIEGGTQRVRNYGHERGDNRSLPFVHLSVSALFSTIIDVQ